MQPLTLDYTEAHVRAALRVQDWATLDVWATRLDELDERERDRRESVPLASAALWYAQAGLRVFPLQPGAKLPFKRSRGCHDATTDAERVAAWWHAEPNANVGLATGHVVDVIDIDGPTGVLSYAGAANLPRVLGKVSTPRAGGMHLYVAANGERGNRARLAAGIDYRGRGGYVVAPPSRTELGGYAWLSPLRLDTTRED